MYMHVCMLSSSSCLCGWIEIVERIFLYYMYSLENSGCIEIKIFFLPIFLREKRKKSLYCKNRIYKCILFFNWRTIYTKESIANPQLLTWFVWGERFLHLKWFKKEKNDTDSIINAGIKKSSFFECHKLFRYESCLFGGARLHIYIYMELSA